MKIYCLFLIIFLSSCVVVAQPDAFSIKSTKKFKLFGLNHKNKNLQTANDSNYQLKFSVDWPVSRKNRILQLLYSDIPNDTVVDIELVCYQLIKDDSVQCYHALFNDVKIKGGVSVTKLPLDKNANLVGSDPVFLEVVKKFEIIPPGEYLTLLTVTNTDTVVIANKHIYRQVDSSLKKGSELRTQANAHFLGKKANRLTKDKHVIVKKIVPRALERNELKIANVRLYKKLKKNDGINCQPEIISGRSYSSIFFKNYFIGRYEIIHGSSMKSKVMAEKEQINLNPSSLINNELNSFTSLLSETKDVFRKKEKKEKSTGVIDITSNWGNGQEPSSEQDNNYQEFRGQVNTEILKIPVSVEGFYTTQDRNRIAKASYVRLHYDAEKVKASMSENADAFKNKYRESKAKSGNFESATRAYLSGAENQIASLYKELETDFSIDKKLLDSYSGDIEALMSDKMPDNTDVTKDKKIKIRKKYEKLHKAQLTIDKYTSLIEQYQTGMFFDSALVYSKLKDIEGKGASSKTIAKSAENILPDGKTKKFLSGLTSLDIGILNEYESKYTLSGQTLKGGKVGYDFNVVNATVAIGKTEYISRDGNLDRYNSSILKLDFKQFFNQKVGLIYYMNTPTKKVFESQDFTKDISLPTFKDPVHIVSINYEGSIIKDMTLQSEGAASFKKSDRTKEVSEDNTALTTSLNYLIPKTQVSIMAEWEHIGRLFENNSLPYIRAATERYTVAGKSDFFRKFITVGIQYNFMKQSTFASTGKSKKWGFDVKTNSRRYPTIYLSYKPFSTFRSFTDTLAIQQRPMLGEVWIARGMYRLKRNKISHNFIVVYNKNSSSLDTLDYSSTTAQLGYILTTQSNVISVNGGWASLYSNASENIENYFIQAGISRRINEQITCNVGQDISLAQFGIQRTSTTLGGSFNFEKLPVTVRLQGRYTNFKLNEQALNQRLFAVQVGVNVFFGKQKY